MQVNHSRSGDRKQDKLLQTEAADPPDPFKHLLLNHHIYKQHLHLSNSQQGNYSSQN